MWAQHYVPLGATNFSFGSSSASLALSAASLGAGQAASARGANVINKSEYERWFCTDFT